MKNRKIFVNHKMAMMDIQIEQYFSLGIRLKRKLGSHNSCIMSKQGTDHHDVSQSTNLLPSPFACRLKISSRSEYLNKIK